MRRMRLSLEDKQLATLAAFAKLRGFRSAGDFLLFAGVGYMARYPVSNAQQALFDEYLRELQKDGSKVQP